MNCAPSPLAIREAHFNALTRNGRDHPNTTIFAEILSSWHIGYGVLPHWLGLTQQQFDELHQFHFGSTTTKGVTPIADRLDHRLDDLKEDLVELLKRYSVDDTQSTAWALEIVTTACLGSNHLWEDLGVWNRASLSQLLENNFPELAAKNTKDMKWKKFLFKQLCEAEGIYVCRAPSCEECIDYDDCFGPE